MSLRTQAVHGVRWSTASQVARQFMQVVSNVILARLLLPQDFGLMGMAMIAVGFISIFKDLGTSAALIHETSPTERLKDTVYWLNVGFGLFAALIFWFSAPFVAQFYGEPRLTAVLQALAITLIISSMSIVHKAMLEKGMSFKAVAIVEAASAVLGYSTGLFFALHGHGVFSLVAQAIANAVTSTLLLWHFYRWRPRLVFSLAEARMISGFSANLIGFNLFNYFSRNLDNILVGKFLGSQALGYYSLAYNIMLYPISNISAVIVRVLFPALAQVKDDHVRFRRAYLKVIACIAYVAFPLMAGLEAVSDNFVLAVFGEKWQPVAVLLMILAPVGLSQSIGTTVGTIYQAKGRTDIMFRWGAFISLITAVAFSIGLHWGIYGMAIAYAATLPLGYPSFQIPFKLIGLRMRDFGAELWRPFTCSVAMMAAILATKPLIANMGSPALSLSLLITFGALVYLGLCWFISRHQVLTLLEAIRSR